MRIKDCELDLDADLEGSYQGEPFTGVVVEYFPGGEIHSEMPYVDGRQEGVGRDWYPTGKLAGESSYKNNHLDGITREWFESGQLKLEAVFEQGTQVSRREWDESGELTLDWELSEDDARYKFIERSRAGNAGG